MDDQVPESDKPLPISFWSEPAPVTFGEPDRSMLSQEVQSMLSPADLELRDWMPSFASKGLSEDDVHALQNTFSQHMGQELRTYDQIFQHVCMVQIAATRQPEIDPIWVAQHAAFTPTSYVETELQASDPAAEPVQGDNPTQEPKAKRLPAAETQAKRNAIQIANEAWRESIAQRKTAVAQWDEYVKQKHEEFKRLRDS